MTQEPTRSTLSAQVKTSTRPMDATPDKESEDLNPYRLHSRREILALLRTIAGQKQMLNMLANRDSTAIVTTILNIDDVAGTLIVDCAQRGYMNDSILQSDNISFETALEQVRILFFVDRIEQCMYEGAPALKLELPRSVIRVQRREFYRVPTLAGAPVSCTITIPQTDSGEGRPVTLVLQNVSGGGIALIDAQGVLDQTIGRIYRNCRIDLPGGALVVTSLELRNLQEIRLPDGKTANRLGCLFLDLPHVMLAAVQRYISKLEREQNARASGRLG